MIEIAGCKGCCLTLILIPLLCLAMVACGVIFVTSISSDAPVDDDFQPTVNEANAFTDNINQATADAARQGWFALVISERQFSSWLALESEQFSESADHAVDFSNVQAGFDNGQITFYAEVERYGITLPVTVVIEPGFDDRGHFDFGVAEASVVGVPLPHQVLEMVQEQIDDALAQPFDEMRYDYFLYQDSLSIQDGVFVVQGGVIR